jgi:thiosulfate dehydrogenase [quinone] large subunit
LQRKPRSALVSAMAGVEVESAVLRYEAAAQTHSNNISPINTSRWILSFTLDFHAGVYSKAKLNMNKKLIKLFLRFAISTAFLSAVADRFGMWNEKVSAWGNWNSFLDYTRVINPWMPDAAISALGFIATAAEIIFALFLMVGFKTELSAKLSGFLLLLFALSMTFSVGIKPVFDYSVFTASAAAFALSLLKEKYFEVDNLISKTKN